MNKTKTLFLLTKTYPFGHGEQYITNELSYLSKVFIKIIIYPNDYYNSNIEHIKPLPNNVEILNFNEQLLNSSSNNFFDYVYLIKNTMLEFIETDDKNNFFKNFKWNLINFWTQYKIAKSFSIYLKENNYNSDNAVFYSYWFHKSAILLSILREKKQIHQFVSRAHSVDLYHNKWGLINESVKVPPFKMFKLKHCIKINTISKHGELFLKNQFPSYSNKFSTHYLGVSDGNNNVSKKQSSKFHIVTCSHIVANKRIHILAEVLLKMKAPILWTHFGSGELENKVFAIADKFDKNFIEFDFKGNIPNIDVQKYYNEHQVNLFINLSIVEGIPVSIMEAMSNSIPILATNIYGVPEAVIDKENGFLLNADFTLDELINKLNYCINNKDELLVMGIKSRELFLQKFSAEKNYKEFANYLINL